MIAALFLTTNFLSPGFADNIALPEIGDPSGNVLSPAAEKQLGQAFMRSIRAYQPVITDPLMSSYIESLGARLVRKSADPGRQFHFFLIHDNQINAFAGPGGYIGVYTGLFLATESESELASVVAHEIAHVTQNHLVRTFDAMQRLSLPMAALAVAALVLGAATDNTDAGLAAATGIQAGMAQQQINFTRYHEEEADRLGIQNLAGADFDPHAMPVFFGRMGKATRLYDDGTLPEFLRTHPVTSNRIADARGRADDYPYRQRPDSLEYHLVRAALRVSSFSSAKDAVTNFRKTLNGKRYRNEEAERYGYALALTANKQYGKAKKQLDILQRNRPEQLAYMIAQAKVLKESGQPDKGLQVLRDGLDLYPGNYALTLHYANALLDQGKAAKALKLLEDQARGRPDDEQIYKLLARAAGESGSRSLGHQYLSDYYYLSGQLEPAIQQLQIAMEDDTADYYQSAQMAARMNQLRGELAELRQRTR